MSESKAISNERFLRNQLVLLRRKYFRSIMQKQQIGSIDAAYPRLKLANVDGFFDNLVLVLVEGMQGSIDCEKYQYLDLRRNGDTLDIMKKECSNAVLEVSFLNRMIRHNHNNNSDSVDSLDSLSTNDEKRNSVSRKIADEVEDNDVALAAERNFRTLKQKEIQKSISLMRTNQIALCKKKREEVKSVLELYALRETQAPVSENMDLSCKLKNSLSSEKDITEASICQNDCRPSNYQLFENSAPFIGVMIEIWAMLSACKKMGKIKHIPSLGSFQQALLNLCPYRSDIIRKVEVQSKQNFDIYEINFDHPEPDMLIKLGLQICLALVESYEEMMTVSDSEDRLNNEAGLIINEITWKEIGRTVILCKLAERVGLSNSETLGLFKGKGSYQAFDSVDRKLLKLCRKRVQARRYFIDEQKSPLWETSMYSFEHQFRIFDSSWIKPLLRFVLPPSFDTSYCHRSYVRYANFHQFSNNWKDQAVIEAGQSIHSGFIKSLFNLSALILQLQPNWISLGEWKYNLLQLLQTNKDDISPSDAKNCVNEAIKLYLQNIDDEESQKFSKVLNHYGLHKIADLEITSGVESLSENSVDNSPYISYLFERETSIFLPSVIKLHDDKRTDSSIYQGTSKEKDSEIIERCFLVLNTIMNLPMAEPFIFPVDKDRVPSYYNLIRQPLSLMEVKGYLEKGLLKNALSEFYISVLFVFQNSLSFNVIEGSELRITTIKMISIFDRLFAEVVLNIESPLLQPSLCNHCKTERELYPSRTAVCERCDGIYHTSCVGLKCSPRNDWFCQKCIEEWDILQIHPFLGLSVRSSKYSSSFGKVVKVVRGTTALLFVVQFNKLSNEYWSGTDVIKNLSDVPQKILSFMSQVDIADYNFACFLSSGYSGWKSSKYTIPPFMMSTHATKASLNSEEDPTFDLQRKSAFILSTDSVSWNAEDWCCVLRTLVEHIPIDWQNSMSPDEQQKLVNEILQQLYDEDSNTTEEQRNTSVNIDFISSAEDFNNIENRSTVPDSVISYESYISQLRGAEEALQAHQITLEIASSTDISEECNSDDNFSHQNIGSFYQSVVNSIARSLLVRSTDRGILEEWYRGWNGQMMEICRLVDSDCSGLNRSTCAFCGGDELSICSPFVVNAQTYVEWRKSKQFKLSFKQNPNSRKTAGESLGMLYSIGSIRDSLNNAESRPESSSGGLLAHQFCAANIEALRQTIFRNNISYFSRDIVETLCKVRSGVSCVLGYDRNDTVFWYIHDLHGVVACSMKENKFRSNFSWYNYSKITGLLNCLAVDDLQERKLKQVLLEGMRYIFVSNQEEPCGSHSMAADISMKSRSGELLKKRFVVGDIVGVKLFRKVKKEYVKRKILEVRCVSLPANETEVFFRIDLDEDCSSMFPCYSWIHESSIFDLNGNTSNVDTSVMRFSFTNCFSRLRAIKYSDYPDRYTFPVRFGTTFESADIISTIRKAILVVHSALPKGSLDPSEERWGNEFCPIFREAVIHANSATSLMECVLLLEYGLQSSWYDFSKGTNLLPSRSIAMKNATLSSVAMRLFQLDLTVKYEKNI